MKPKHIKPRKEELRNVRINRLGWSPEKAFTTKPQERKETKKNEAALL